MLFVCALVFLQVLSLFLTGFWYTSNVNFGWCLLFSLLQIFKYTICFGSTGHTQDYNLVCRSFKATVTAAGSFLDWHCAAVHVFLIDYFRWSNFLSCFGARQSWNVLVFLFSSTLLCGWPSCLLHGYGYL
jgi:hypothetical protein